MSPTEERWLKGGMDFAGEMIVDLHRLRIELLRIRVSRKADIYEIPKMKKIATLINEFEKKYDQATEKLALLSQDFITSTFKES